MHAQRMMIQLLLLPLASLTLAAHFQSRTGSNSHLAGQQHPHRAGPQYRSGPAGPQYPLGRRQGQPRTPGLFSGIQNLKNNIFGFFSKGLKGPPPPRPANPHTTRPTQSQVNQFFPSAPPPSRPPLPSAGTQSSSLYPSFTSFEVGRPSLHTIPAPDLNLPAFHENSGPVPFQEPSNHVTSGLRPSHVTSNHVTSGLRPSQETFIHGSGNPVVFNSGVSSHHTSAAESEYHLPDSIKNFGAPAFIDHDKETEDTEIPSGSFIDLTGGQVHSISTQQKQNIKDNVDINLINSIRADLWRKDLEGINFGHKKKTHG